MLVQMVEDSLALLENSGMQRKNNPPWQVLSFPPDASNTGSISFLWETNSHCYIHMDCILNQPFSYSHRIEEQYIVFRLLPDSPAGGLPPISLFPNHGGMRDDSVFFVNKRSLTKSWRYLPEGTVLKGDIILISEHLWRSRLGTMIRKQFGSEVDLPRILEHIAAQSMSELREILTAFNKKGDPRPALQSKKNELLGFFRNQLKFMSKRPAFLQGNYERNIALETMHFIQKNIVSTPCVEDLSRRAGINVHKLEAAFREVAGLSIAEYTRAYRMELAIDMLDQGMNMKEISARIGYKSVNRFCEAFEHLFGARPIQYKAVRRHRQASSIISKP